MNIAVIGGGTAGPAAAVFLQRAGNAVTLFEKIAKPEAVGAGLLVQPPALRVLHDLGVLESILDCGAKITTVQGYIETGRRVLGLDYRDLHPDLFALGLHRGALQSTLLGAVERSKVPMVCGVDVEELESAPAISSASLGKKFLRDSSGARHGPYDLIVFADGAKSKLRPKRARVSSYDWGGMWAIVRPDAASYESLYAARLSQHYKGATRFCGFLPTGSDGGCSVTEVKQRRGLVTLFWSIRCDEMPAARRAGLAAWKERARASHRDIEPLLEQITDMDQLLLAQYQNTHLYPYYEDNCVWIGDAAHSMNPTLGNGCNMALMDAYTLTQCLSRHPTSLSEALQVYSKLRRPQVRFYQWTSTFINPMFQSSLPGAHLPRDYGMGPASAMVPWLQEQQALSLAGVKTGFFCRMNPDPLALFVKECGHLFNRALA